ncbi:MAG: DNA repair protein RadC [Bacteroidetes bacterium]|nr:DNA repair protein RadC [Bacteroidota bacterium]
MKKLRNSHDVALEQGLSYQNLIPMNQWKEDDVPIEKLLMKGSASLSDAELLSIVIGNNSSQINSLDLARIILADCSNNLCRLWKLSIAELMGYHGITKTNAVRICSMFSLARRRNEAEVLSQEKVVNSSSAFEIFKSVIGDIPYEEFWILILSRANKVLDKVRISEGGVSGTVVDPKKIFKICLDNHACSIILGHNHPSGNIQPSEADQKITKKIKNGGEMLDIAVLDHIIIGDDRYYSFADEGII